MRYTRGLVIFNVVISDDGTEWALSLEASTAGRSS